MTFTESILRVCSAVEKPLFLSFACWDFDVMLAKDFYWLFEAFRTSFLPHVNEMP
jgi:hypothetical protein